MAESIRERIFISYSHQDEAWLDRFLRMLKPAMGPNALDVWCDKDIEAGDDWKNSIDSRLNSATVAVLLVSDYFLASDFIAQVELPAILDAAVHRGLKIYWVPLSATTVEWTPLGKYQACWPPNQPLDSLVPHEQNRAIRDVCCQIYDKSDQLVITSHEQRDLLRQNVQRVIPENLKIAVDEAIGGGDYSVVYSGTMDDKKVAIKVLVDSPLKKRTENFKKTAVLAADYEHPCFIRVRQVCVDAEPHCLIMDYMDAAMVADVLAHNGPLPIDLVTKLIQGLVEALEEHHTHGLIYGGIYPQDVFLDPSPRLRISALGISSYLSRQDHFKGNFPANCRATTYIGPEQYYGDSLSQKSDQYALGLFTFELLQGEPPFRVTCAADYARKPEFFNDPAAYAGAWKERHPALAQIVFRMLHQDPNERWPSMSAIAEALKGLDPEAVMLAKGSYRAHCQGNHDFYAKFYDRFFARCPETQKLFGDLTQQYTKLDYAMQFLLNFRHQAVEPTVLTPVAERHRALNVTPRQFDEFAAALMDTLRDVCHEDEAVLQAWQATIAPGFQYLKGGGCPMSKLKVVKATAAVPHKRRASDRPLPNLAVTGSRTSRDISHKHVH